jgi:hypothetical protein
MLWPPSGSTTSQLPGSICDPPPGYRRGMCRSIKTLRAPYVEELTSEDVHAAALQYVRKVAGMRQPSAANQPAFDLAVEQIAASTSTLSPG